MALSNAWVHAPNRIPAVFQKIRDGQAPERFTQQLLKDWGHGTKNDRAFIPLLKGLGFLTEDGRPTQRYNDYRDHSRSRQIIGQALRQAYSDIFLIKEHPTEADRNAIQGKFKSFHNASDNVAGLMAKTFLALLAIADISDSRTDLAETVPAEQASEPVETLRIPHTASAVGLHYNIQVHLPATKDVEVYNAIFKSLRTHLVEG